MSVSGHQENSFESIPFAKPQVTNTLSLSEVLPWPSWTLIRGNLVQKQTLNLTESGFRRTAVRRSTSAKRPDR